MNRLQVKYTSIFILLLSLVMVVGACSNDKKEQDKEKEETVVEEPENSNGNNINEEDIEIDEQEDKGEADEVDETVEEGTGTQVEHQKGLKLGDTGTVVSGTLSENDRYEITLNDMELLTEVEGETNYNEIFVKANVAIKNIEEQPLPLDAIFRPTVGDENLEDIELFPEFKKEFFTDEKGTVFEGNEIAPGETVYANYYFDTVKADYYRFAFGNPSDQIVTFANWKIKKEEM